MAQTTREKAIKKLQTELKEEKQAEITRRREITRERKEAVQERLRLEEDKAKVSFVCEHMDALQYLMHDVQKQMGARKAARLRRRAGRTKKING
jgi:rRNA-processing protein CGR1